MQYTSEIKLKNLDTGAIWQPPLDACRALSCEASLEKPYANLVTMSGALIVQSLPWEKQKFLVHGEGMTSPDFRSIDVTKHYDFYSCNPEDVSFVGSVPTSFQLPSAMPVPHRIRSDDPQMLPHLEAFDASGMRMVAGGLAVMGSNSISWTFPQGFVPVRATLSYFPIFEVSIDPIAPPVIDESRRSTWTLSMRTV